MLKSLGLTNPAAIARWLTNRFNLKVVVLLYHRIAEHEADPYALSVTPEHFAEHLEILRKRFYPITLQQLGQALRDDNLQRRTVVVTFDDGYADNYYNAEPILERYDIPATVFVTAGYIDRERGFWWDELEWLLVRSGTFPEALRLGIGGKDYRWTRIQSMRARRQLYHELGRLLQLSSEEERQRVLHQVHEWGGTLSSNHSLHPVLSSDEVLRLAEGGLIEVGAHTLTHPMLSLLSPSDQRVEIQGSKARLEELTGRPVTSFAYPYGLPADYTAETVAIVRQVGFDCACSAVVDSVRSQADRYQLPRIPVLDWGGERLEWLMQWWEV